MTVNDDRLALLEGRLDRVAASTTDLRLAIEAQREPLEVLADIKAENQEIKRRADAAEKAVKKAQVDQEERTKRARSALGLLGGAAIAVLLVVTFLTFAALIGYVRTLLDRDDASRYRSCQTRNAAAGMQVRREEALSRLDVLAPAERRVHAQSARDLSALLVDCSLNRRT